MATWNWRELTKAANMHSNTPFESNPSSHCRLRARFFFNRQYCFRLCRAILGLSVAMHSHIASAQAPGLQWTINLGATPFAVDAQTNVYANAGGKVIVINSAGIPLATNAICPLPGLAASDAASNYYFAGSFVATQDFGGIVLRGGQPGFPSGFLAKYGPGGNLLWATNYQNGSTATAAADLLPASDGSCYFGFTTPAPIGSAIVHVNASGTLDWLWNLGTSVSVAIKLGGLTTSNCCFFDFQGQASGGRIATDGSRLFFQPPMLSWTYTSESTNAKPAVDDLGQAFRAGIEFTSPHPKTLCKCDTSGAVLWCQDIGTEEQWTLGRDPQANVYLAAASGLFSKRTTDGVLVWSTNYGPECTRMLVDLSGNRFLGFANGSIARLANELPPQAPTILAGPQPQTVFVGDNATFAVSATGTQPLAYSWRLSGTNLPGASSSSLALTSVVQAQAGVYTVVVTNVAGAVTSAPALLRIKSVELYLGTQLLTNETYAFSAPPTLTLRSAFTNGSSFYTLDGSAPSFLATPYSGPFALYQTATVRAIGYSADFSQSEEADAITATIPVRHTLTIVNSGGGSVTLNPPGGVYASSDTVTASALPSAGWSFLYWLGDVTGTNLSVNIAMATDKIIQAVFGTTLSTTTAGSGQIWLNPPGGLYSFGTVVRLTAVPQAGNFFGSWGNAASGNTNPLYFTVSAPTPTVSSIFATTPNGQAALTIIINGEGRLSVNPRANVFNLGQSITITASPDLGQRFLGWNGDASGTQNPLTISMDQAKVITANFTSQATVHLNRPLDGLSASGFRFSIFSDTQTVWQVLVSSNLNTWTALGTVTNALGEVQFTDPAAIHQPSLFYKVLPWP
jgi:Divergent InlB B-repeat domain/Immunoglobulin domain/Chitobiase/beta-hexosaminidase C-terminal domain